MVLSLAGIMFACEGPAGPDGKDAPREDVIGPVVFLVQPAANSLIMGDTLHLEAAQSSDDTDLAGVAFRINGSGVYGGDTLESEPGSLTLDILLRGGAASYGEMTLQAVARDTAGNIAVSPVILVYRAHPDSSFTLEPSATGGTTVALALPDTISAEVEGQDTGWVFDALATGFEMPADAVLDSVSIALLKTSAGFRETPPLQVMVADAVGGHPGIPADTLSVDLPSAAVYGSHVISLDTLVDGDSAPSVMEHDTVFIIFRPEFPDTLSGAERFSGVGLEYALVARDRSAAQPASGDLWLHSITPGAEGWIRWSTISPDVFYYPQVRLVCRPLGSGT
jgi:hypothetical protein